MYTDIQDLIKPTGDSVSSLDMTSTENNKSKKNLYLRMHSSLYSQDEAYGNSAASHKRKLYAYLLSVLCLKRTVKVILILPLKKLFFLFYFVINHVGYSSFT